jgi:DNA-binding protein YbaB
MSEDLKMIQKSNDKTEFYISHLGGFVEIYMDGSIWSVVWEILRSLLQEDAQS